LLLCLNTDILRFTSLHDAWLLLIFSHWYWIYCIATAISFHLYTLFTFILAIYLFTLPFWFDYYVWLYWYCLHTLILSHYNTFISHLNLSALSLIIFIFAFISWRHFFILRFHYIYSLMPLRHFFLLHLLRLFSAFSWYSHIIEITSLYFLAGCWLLAILMLVSADYCRHYFITTHYYFHFTYFRLNISPLYLLLLSWWPLLTAIATAAIFSLEPLLPDYLISFSLISHFSFI